MTDALKLFVELALVRISGQCGTHTADSRRAHVQTDAIVRVRVSAGAVGGIRRGFVGGRLAVAVRFQLAGRESRQNVGRPRGGRTDSWTRGRGGPDAGRGSRYLNVSPVGRGKGWRGGGGGSLVIGRHAYGWS